MPTKKLLNDRETFDTEVARSFAIAGNPGRYMSMEKGLSAVRLPSIRMSETYLDFVIQC